jgi:hypothetical protein
MESTPDSCRSSLAAYVLRLSESLANTQQANDRPLYRRLLADAAPLLALVVEGCRTTEISAAVQRHERLSSELFLSGPEYAAIAESWRAFREVYATSII